MTFNVASFGALGDGNTLDTDAINKAVKACAEQGGGVIYFPPGKYLSGSIRLASNIELRIDSLAEICGASNYISAYDSAEASEWGEYQDYGHSHFRNALIWGEELNNISITGGGTINGGGITRSNKVPQGGGDKTISLKLCSGIVIKNITIKQGGHFAVLATGCKNLSILNVDVFTPRDGFDIVACSNVIIDGCHVEAVRYENGQKAGGDDAIALKSDYALGYPLLSENIVVKNCYVVGGANGLQIGSETVGDFRNISFCNIIIGGAEKSGIGITTNDGAVIDGVSFTNIEMEKVCAPFYVIVTDRMRRPDSVRPGVIKNITFENISAKDIAGYVKKRGPWTCAVNGMRESIIENISFKNITLHYKGGFNNDWESITPPDPPENYSPRHLGKRPASGFYIRYANNINFDSIELHYDNMDYRPVFYFDKSSSIDLNDISYENIPDTDCKVYLKDVSGFSSRGFKNMDDVNIPQAEGLKLN